MVDPVVPAHAASHIDVLKHVGQSQQGSYRLNEQEHQDRDERSRSELGGNADGICIDQEERCEDESHRPGYLAESIPIPQSPDANQPQCEGQAGEKNNFIWLGKGFQGPDIAQAKDNGQPGKRKNRISQAQARARQQHNHHAESEPGPGEIQCPCDHENLPSGEMRQEQFAQGDGDCQEPGSERPNYHHPNGIFPG
jgi:hypothetical protein